MLLVLQLDQNCLYAWLVCTIPLIAYNLKMFVLFICLYHLVPRAYFWLWIQRSLQEVLWGLYTVPGIKQGSKCLATNLTPKLSLQFTELFRDHCIPLLWCLRLIFCCVFRLNQSTESLCKEENICKYNLRVFYDIIFLLTNALNLQCSTN